MKQKIGIALIIFTLIAQACQAPQPGTSVWNIIADTQPFALTTDSKLDEINEDFSGVYTLLDTAQSKADLICTNLESAISTANEIITLENYTAYVANSGTFPGNVTPINLTTNTPGTPIAVGDGPNAVAITPDEAFAYVTSEFNNNVTPINLATNTPGTPIAVGSGPNAIAITPNGAFAYVTNGFANTVTPINLATNTPGTPIVVGFGPRGIAITPDGAFAYVTLAGGNVIPITLATNTPGTPIAVGLSPQGIAITPNGAFAYVTNSGSNSVTPITLGTNTPGTPIAVGNDPRAIAITPNGAFAYVTNSGDNTVTPITLATNTPGTPIAVGLSPQGIAITSDGAYAYVTNFDDNTVTPITLTSNTPGTPIPVGNDPLGIAIRTVSVPSLDFSSVFTAINALEEKLASAESKAELLNQTAFNIEGVFGIAIHSADLGTAGITLSTPGTYFFADYIGYAPGANGTSAITIDADNISLNLNGQTLKQTNAATSTVGIEVAAGHSNIRIINGGIDTFTGQGILINDNNACVQLEDLAILSTGTGIAVSGSQCINMLNVRCTDATTDGAIFDNCTKIQINSNSSFNNNGNDGLRFVSCDEIRIRSSTCNTNTDNGVEYENTSSQHELRELTILDNGAHGIKSTNVTNGLFNNCYITGNTGSGIQLNNCARMQLIENMLNDNDYNIELADGTDNCYIFSNCLMLATNDNLLEDATSGPNSILGNYALATAFADNYNILGSTNVNLDTFDQTGAFPSPAPVAWKNMSVQT